MKILTLLFLLSLITTSILTSKENKDYDNKERLIQIKEEIIEMETKKIKKLQEELLELKNEQTENECRICLQKFDNAQKKPIVFHTTENGIQHKFCLECLKQMVPKDDQFHAVKCPLDNFIPNANELKNLKTKIYSGEYMQVIVPIRPIEHTQVIVPMHSVHTQLIVPEGINQGLVNLEDFGRQAYQAPAEYDFDGNELMAEEEEFRKHYYNCLLYKALYVLAIPNWIIPGLLTLDKAFIMAILQFVLRIPRDLPNATIINVYVSSGILLANSILLGEMYGPEGEGILPDGKQIGFAIAIPIVLDLRRWFRWECEIHESKVHYDEIVNKNEKTWIDAIFAIICFTNYFMPIVLQPTYYAIMFPFLWFQFIRLFETETVFLLFAANVTARCLAYNESPDNLQIWSVVGPFILFFCYVFGHAE